MKNIAEFQQLFNVNLPIEENYQYYIDTLMKSEFYAGLEDLIKEFEQYEKDIEEQGIYKSIKSYKLDYALPKMKDYILASDAYKKIMDKDFGNSKIRTKDELRINDNTYLISVDFTSANYSALKTYDSSNELSNSWGALCDSLEIHQCLAKSKSFRQYLFGNTSPKRLQKIQHSNIVTIVDKLIENHGFEEDDFVLISHDEFIVRLRPDHILAVSRIGTLLNAVDVIINEEGINMPTHYKVFKNEAIGAGMCVQTNYNVKMGGLSEKYSTLFKVPGNVFYFYFKKYIIGEELEDRDLYFIVDKKLAKWVI